MPAQWMLLFSGHYKYPYFGSNMHTEYIWLQNKIDYGGRCLLFP